MNVQQFVIFNTELGVFTLATFSLSLSLNVQLWWSRDTNSQNRDQVSGEFVHRSTLCVCFVFLMFWSYIRTASTVWWLISFDFSFYFWKYLFNPQQLTALVWAMITVFRWWTEKRSLTMRLQQETTLCMLLQRMLLNSSSTKWKVAFILTGSLYQWGRPPRSIVPTKFPPGYKNKPMHIQWVCPIFSISTETAQSALGSDVTEAVITVPFEFAHAQKLALR